MENLAYEAKQGFTASGARGRTGGVLWLVFLACALGSQALWK